MTIPKAIQLTAGRIAQEYNQRKKRKGAYWEDRYHATAIETGNHLLRCIAYIDLNMVRAGVVSHPSKWVFGGYNEIQSPRRKTQSLDDGFQLREEVMSYIANFDAENSDIAPKNGYKWNTFE